MKQKWFFSLQLLLVWHQFRQPRQALVIPQSEIVIAEQRIVGDFDTLRPGRKENGGYATAGDLLLKLERLRFWWLRWPYILEQNTVMISTKSVQNCSMCGFSGASLRMVI
jgi:hypothetical protein